jgi:3-oxoacyl-[acyl-carrier-protein] synthase-3
MPSRLLGLAHHLPEAQVVGGVSRPIETEPAGPSDLAVAATAEALAHSSTSLGDVDFIVFATMTPDVTFPGAACFLQDKLGCDTIGALDIRGQCAGFVMSLMIADGFLSAGAYRRILLAAAEVHSSGLDYSDRGIELASRYGDGSAVAILGYDEKPGGIEAVVCHTDGRYYDRFWCEFPASRQHPTRLTAENFRQGRHFPSLDAEIVRSFGVEHLPEVIREALNEADTSAERVDCFVLSHIFPEVAEQSAATLSLPSSKVIVAGSTEGHLTAASLPVALSKAQLEGRVGPGARVCLATCGAGFAWGAAVVTL